jgi:hypothetical protein
MIDGIICDIARLPQTPNWVLYHDAEPNPDRVMGPRNRSAAMRLETTDGTPLAKNYQIIDISCVIFPSLGPG